MSSFRNPKSLTEEELLRLLEEDDDDDYFIPASDDEMSDHLSEEEEFEDDIGGDPNDTLTEQHDGNDGDALSNADIDANPHYITRQEDIHWSKVPFNTRVRRSQANVVSTRKGLTAHGSKFSTMDEAFALFLSNKIVGILVTETNRKMEDFYRKWNDAHPLNKRTLIPTDEVEVRAYVGLLIVMGALQASKESVQILWTSDTAYSRSIIPATMSKNRYKILTSFLRFDNFETRMERKVTDKLAPIREIIDEFVANCKKAYNPGDHLCIDEQLVPFRGRAPFRVYMKSKPDKYGLKIWALADCETSYTLNMQVYLGKQHGKAEVGQGERVVLDLTRYLGQGYGLTVDNFFTSMELADKLWERKITLLGTLRKNKKYIPNELLPKSWKPVKSSMFAFRNNRTLVSYVPKKNRAVILLSTEHVDDKVSGEENDFKPDMILQYNKTKGAVDTVDKLAKQYSCQRKTNRWPMALFEHLVDLAGINAFKLWRIKFPEWEAQKKDSRRIFLLQLGKCLIRDQATKRFQNRNGLQLSIQQHIRISFPEVAAENVTIQPRVVPTGSQGRCLLCPRTRDRKSRTCCADCNNFVCAEHSKRMVKCDHCSNRND